jgi:hypothetical protein
LGFGELAVGGWKDWGCRLENKSISLVNDLQNSVKMGLTFAW